MAIKGREIIINQVDTGSNPNLLDVPLLNSKGNSRKRDKIVFLLPLEGEFEKLGDALGLLGENFQTKGLGRREVKNYFLVLQIFSSKISVETDLKKKPLDQSSPSEVCGSTLLVGMAQAPQPSDNGYLSNVEGGKIFF
jgi:hypothetical protein